MNYELIYFFFYLTNPLKFFLFYLNYADFCEMFRLVMNNLQENSIERAEKDEKWFKNLLLLWCSFYAFFFVYFVALTFSSMSSDFVMLFTAVSFVSGLVGDFSNILLQFSYLNLSIQICSLYRQLEDDLEDMELILSEQQVVTKLRTFVENHREVIELKRKLFSSFRSVISLNFVVNTLFIGQALLFSNSADWATFLGYFPFLMFDFWIYCFASQLIITKVNLLKQLK